MSSTPPPKKAIDLNLVIQMALLLFQHVPEIMDAIHSFKKKEDRDPTPEEVRALIADLKPPDQY